jgi:hypothetical protein
MMWWTCPSCGWRQSDDRPRICGRYGEPCPGLPLPTSADPQSGEAVPALSAPDELIPPAPSGNRAETDGLSNSSREE